MILSKFAKVGLKTSLSSEWWLISAFRKIVANILFGLSAVIRPFNVDISLIFNLYGCVLLFNPDKFTSKFNSHSTALGKHLVIASRGFFEVAFSRGELLKISNFLRKITTLYPNIFIPWKLLHYCYFHTKSWELLFEVNDSYEKLRRDKLKSYGVLGYDLIAGDHITASIGHSLIFFDFQIFNACSSIKPVKIAITRSNRDIMSGFYKEAITGLITDEILIDSSNSEPSDLINFIQDSFPFLTTKKYFNYSDDKGRARHLGSWAVNGAKPFSLSDLQRAQLNSFLNDLGVGPQDWYVVLHVREGQDNSLRNANINSYYGALSAITECGGWVFRIGDTAMTPLPKNLYRVIDLPFTEFPRPAYIDMYLLASARFVICTCSGPSEFPFYFNVPRLTTNWPFMPVLYGTSNDRCLPVAYYRAFDNQTIPLREQLNSVSYENEPNVRALNKVRPISNSFKQIQQAAVEMIEVTSGNFEGSKFPNLIPNSLASRFKGKIWFMGSIAKSFLEDNQNYLD